MQAYRVTFRPCGINNLAGPPAVRVCLDNAKVHLGITPDMIQMFQRSIIDHRIDLDWCYVEIDSVEYLGRACHPEH